jgi:hypothetical protein
MGRKKHTTADLLAASEHLDYEILMLTAVANALDSGISVLSPMHNALVESFAIHLRNLADFLWPGNPDNDWVVAPDYFDDPKEWQDSWKPIPTRLRTARIRAAKEIAHLTYGRIKLTSSTKEWDYVGLRDEIVESLAEFVSKVDKKKVCPELLEAG